MKHHILVKWNKEVENKEALIPAINELFQKTTEIDGITKVELIPNVIPRPNRYDLLIAITMDETALPVYDECEYHKQWKQEYGKLIEAKAIFDSAE